MHDVHGVHHMHHINGHNLTSHFVIEGAPRPIDEGAEPGRTRQDLGGGEGAGGAGGNVGAGPGGARQRRPGGGGHHRLHRRHRHCQPQGAPAHFKAPGGPGLV